MRFAGRFRSCRSGGAGRLSILFMRFKMKVEQQMLELKGVLSILFMRF